MLTPSKRPLYTSRCSCRLICRMMSNMLGMYRCYYLFGWSCKPCCPWMIILHCHLAPVHTVLQPSPLALFAPYAACQCAWLVKWEGHRDMEQAAVSQGCSALNDWEEWGETYSFLSMALNSSKCHWIKGHSFHGLQMPFISMISSQLKVSGSQSIPFVHFCVDPAPLASCFLGKAISAKYQRQYKLMRFSVKALESSGKECYKLMMSDKYSKRAPPCHCRYFKPALFLISL